MFVKQPAVATAKAISTQSWPKHGYQGIIRKNHSMRTPDGGAILKQRECH